MDWLSQNWIWLALGIGAILMISRGGNGGCCGGDGHSGGGQPSESAGVPPKETARPGVGQQH